MEVIHVTTSPIILSHDDCLSLFNQSNQSINGSFCPAYFDRIGCWPPTPAGTVQRIACPSTVFPDANPKAFATRFCTNGSAWEERGQYGLCIGCPTVNSSDPTYDGSFSLPPTYIEIRRHFVIGANALSIVFLFLGIIILLGNSRLRSCSRNILHVNMFLVFFIRSIIQLIAELHMSKGYFQHNVFERVDACNRTHTYFQENSLLDCQLFTVFANYINSSVSHWFVFCEALFLFRLLRAKACKDRIKVYIYTGWLVPLVLTILTYTARIVARENLNTCWFEPSIYDWILHGPNVLLQIFNFIIFNYICILLVRKLNEDYRLFAFIEQRRFAKYSRLARSTLILLPLFSIHYFLFMWNTRPLLIPHLILIHLTVHTISSSLQGFMVAFIYTLMNAEVQRELLRSIDRWFVQHHSSWQQPEILRNYMHKLENQRFYTCTYATRSSTPVQSRSLQISNLLEDCSYLDCPQRANVNHPMCQVLINKNSESAQSTSTN